MMMYFRFRNKLYRWDPKVLLKNLAIGAAVAANGAFYGWAIFNALETGIW